VDIVASAFYTLDSTCCLICVSFAYSVGFVSEGSERLYLAQENEAFMG